MADLSDVVEEPAHVTAPGKFHYVAAMAAGQGRAANAAMRTCMNDYAAAMMLMACSKGEVATNSRQILRVTMGKECSAKAIKECKDVDTRHLLVPSSITLTQNDADGIK